MSGLAKTMTERGLAMLEQLLEASTGDPWYVDQVGASRSTPGVRITDGRAYVIGSTRTIGDAELIVAARTMLPVLVADVRRLRKLVRDVEELTIDKRLVDLLQAYHEEHTHNGIACGERHG